MSMSMSRTLARALVGAAAVLAAAPGAAVAAGPPSWVASWGLPINSSRTTAFSNRTLREVAQTSLGGTQVRVRLSNDNGTQPIALSDLHVGLAGTGAAVSGANLPLTVGGANAVTIAPGTSVLSDPVALAVPDGASLAVSVFTAGSTGRGTGDGEIGAYYQATGDHAADADATAFGTRSSGGWFVTGVDVYTPNDGAVVGFGDSITAGFNAGGVGWPTYLAQDLATAGGPRVGVVNMGISGNEVTLDRPNFGVSALHRWQRDVLDQTGVRLVLMMEGINDIGANAVPASSIEAAYQTLQSESYAAHVNLLVSPLTPAGDPAVPASQYGGDYSTPLGIQIRHDFDAWLKTTALYDPLLDFAAAVQNPSDPDEMAPSLDSGDHLHPSATGQRAMAASVPVSSPAFAAALSRLVTTGSGDAGGTVPATLTLVVGPPAAFGTFTPGVGAVYSAQNSADVISTAGNALLTVSDPDPAHPGHLVNGSDFLAQPLQMRATKAGTTGTAFNPIGASFNLLSWSAPVSHDAVTLEYRQAIGAGEPLRTGSYAKTLTFTLSTTQP
jgi:lysophospholipase L1-like esterase